MADSTGFSQYSLAFSSILNWDAEVFNVTLYRNIYTCTFFFWVESLLGGSGIKFYSNRR